MAEHDGGPVREGAPSQTLSRALTLLETVVEAPEPPTIADLADGLGVHRSVAYRMLRTFEAHGLLRRDGLGRVHAAPGLAVLARRVEQDLRAAAMPHLTAVSTDLGMTAFLVVWDGAHCLTLATAEPPSGNLVTQRPGTRHPLGVGAPGMAIAATLTPAIEARLKANPEMQKKMMEKYVIRRPGLPSDVANMVLFLASEASAWITGQTYPVNGGFTFAL